MNLNLFLGQRRDGRDIFWTNTENAHISILGQSGTGKTYLISRLAKEACRHGFDVVIPDYSNSFLQMQIPVFCTPMFAKSVWISC